MRIDSHHHFWKYTPNEYGWMSDRMSILRRDYLPDELRALLDQAKIDRVVSVQARQTLEETRWLIELAEAHPFVAGVVGWLPLRDERLEEVLGPLASMRPLKGVRHVVQDEPDERFLLDDAFNRGVACLKAFSWVYDILIYARHLPVSIAFVDRHPEQLFVVDHCAKPTIRQKAFDHEWAKGIRELAKRPQVACKFSGLTTEVQDADWTLETIRPYWDVVLEAFGPDRLMYGSDWPVCLLRSEYSRWLSVIETLAETLSMTEKTFFWGGNAQRIYRLDTCD